MAYALLVPCYNAAAYIDGFIENIGQLLKPFDQVIFYDDASTDNTAQLLKSKGFEVIKGEINQGPGYARNILAKRSDCEWFHFHDIDDRLDPPYLTRVAAIAEKNDADVVLCNVNWYDSQSNNLVLSWAYSDSEIIKDPLAYTITHPIGGINGLYKKTKFIETGGFNTAIRIWEDADIHVKLAGKGAKFRVIEEVLSYSIRHPDTASSDQGLGWQIRANLLQDYYNAFEEASTRIAIGTQAQLVASRLILSNSYAAARKALELSELCNVKVPLSTSGIWRLFKIILPAWLRIKLRSVQLKIAFNKS